MTPLFRSHVPPRPQALARALVAAVLGLAPVGAPSAVADPIVPAQNSPDKQNRPDSPAGEGAHEADAGGGTASASGAKPAPGVFPENDGALHTSVQANDPMTAAKDAKPIVPAGG